MEEIRSVFCKGIFNHTHDWTNIMQILRDHNISVPITSAILAWQTGDYLEIDTSIQAAKDVGFTEYWFLLECFGATGNHDDWKTVLSDETTYAWACPNKVTVRTALNTFLTELINDNDITGIVWDYVRFKPETELDGKAMCYCNECKAYLEAYLEEIIPPEDWPGEFVPGGICYTEFKTWRHSEFTSLISDMHDTVLGLDDSLTISAAVYPRPWWGTEEWADQYCPMELGQDKKTWLNEGYIDMVSPMIYEETWGGAGGFLDKIETDHIYQDCEKAKYLPFICTGSPETGWVMSEAVFEDEVAKCWELGRGCQIWRYNDEAGWSPPDDGSGENDPPHDIRNYLDGLPPLSGYRMEKTKLARKSWKRKSKLF